MLAIHRQILFWLYLWQLKEYHIGRFLAHFKTAKGKSIFLSPLFSAKLSVLCAFYYFLSNPSPLFVAVVIIIFFPEALRTIVGIVKMDLLRPEITKKSLLLLAICHTIFFGAVLIVFNLFLGEMNSFDLNFAAFSLLALDILLPLVVGFIVLALQPLTVWQKNKIMRQAADIIKNRPDLTVIGITGSYGKTVTKDLLALILSKKYKVLKTQANQNTETGVAQAVINNLKPEHKFFVCEIGAVHKGKIKEVAGMVKPKIGILTGVNQQHLGVFGSQQNIIDAKFELLESLPENGTAVINWRSKSIVESYENQKRKIRAKNTIIAGLDIIANNIEADTKGLLFDINYQSKKNSIITNARGAFMIEPILLAAAGAIAAGMDFDEIALILNRTDFAPFNINIRKNSAGLNIVESTYSTNPDGVLAHLDYLKLWPGEAVSREVPSKPRGKKAIVMPCLIELGSASKQVHFEIGQKIGQVCDLAIITTKDRFADIKKGVLSAGMKPENIIFSEKPAAIVDLIKNRLSSGDVILLEGRVDQKSVKALLR